MAVSVVRCGVSHCSAQRGLPCKVLFNSEDLSALSGARRTHNEREWGGGSASDNGSDRHGSDEGQPRCNNRHDGMHHHTGDLSCVEALHRVCLAASRDGHRTHAGLASLRRLSVRALGSAHSDHQSSEDSARRRRPMPRKISRSAFATSDFPSP